VPATAGFEITLAFKKSHKKVSQICHLERVVDTAGLQALASAEVAAGRGVAAGKDVAVDSVAAGNEAGESSSGPAPSLPGTSSCTSCS
jgi:hypothetical protein